MTDVERAPITDAQLRWMLEQAATEGAKRALREIGLEDERAMHDVHELRDLLRAWRSTKSAVWSTAVKWLTTAVLVGITAAVATHWWDGRR